MTPAPRRQRKASPPDPFPERGLAELGLAPGDQVRFRRSETERWKPATVARRERDGSVGLHDPKGASRAIPVACIEVRDTGPRGGTVWEPLSERAARTEQMALVAASSTADTRSHRVRSVAPVEASGDDDAPAARPSSSPDPVDPDGTPDHGNADDDRGDGQLRLL